MSLDPVDLKLMHTKLTTVNDLNLQGWSWSHKLESLCCKTFKWILKVTNVKVFVQQIQDRKVHEVGSTHGRVSKFYKKYL